MDTELKEANAQQRPHARFAQRARMIACRSVGSGCREQEGSHARARPPTGHEVQSWWARSPAPRHLPRWTGGSMIIPHPAPSGVRLLCMSFTSNGEVASRACPGVRCGRYSSSHPQHRAKPSIVSAKVKVRRRRTAPELFAHFFSAPGSAYSPSPESTPQSAQFEPGNKVQVRVRWKRLGIPACRAD